MNDSRGGDDQATITVDINSVTPSGGPNLYTAVLPNVSSMNWTTVTLPSAYTSMVVIATPNYDAGSPPLVTRIRNANGNQFEIKLARTDGQTDETFANVHYTVVEEGVYNTAEHGITMEARKFTSTVTDSTASWIGEQQIGALVNSYTTPVVIGQVMTANDPQWSVFWTRGASLTVAPSSTSVFMGKHVGASANRNLLDEQIGYIVMEQANGTVGGYQYSAAVGDDIVDGFPQGGADYQINGIDAPLSAVGSVNGVDGTDGSWTVLVGNTPLTETTLSLVTDEDQEADEERGHITEQISYLILGSLDTPADVTLATNDTEILETGGATTLTFTLSNPSATPTLVFYSVTGDATTDQDYFELSGSILVPADATSVTETLQAIADEEVELNETIVITLTGTDNPAVSVNTQPVVVTITDDDNTAPTLAATTFTIFETANGGNLVGTLNASDPDPDETLTYSIVGGSGSGLFDIATSTGGITVASGATFDAGLTPSYQLQVQVNDSRGGADQATITVDINSVTPSGGPNLYTAVLPNVSSMNWTTVTLPSAYSSMVVIATPNYDAGSPPLVTRIRNANGNQFDIKLARADGQTDETVANVHYTVAEEGVYNTAEHGITMEARKFTSTVTDSTASWIGEQQIGALVNSYTTPVVIGQVMTANDPQWSVFWSRGTNRNTPPSATSVFMGKHVGGSADRNLADEQIGYLVIEQAAGTVGNYHFSAALGDDTIDGFTQFGGQYSLSGIDVPIAAVGSVSGVDGTDGSWAVLNGNTPISATTLDFVADEDQESDQERGHTDEQVSYLVLGAASNVTPTAVNDEFTTTQDVTLNITSAAGVLANDFDPNLDDTLTVSLVTDVAQGTLLLDADGSFDYTPNGGFTGIDQFTYELSDGELTDTATVTINVVPATTLTLETGVVNATTESWTTVPLPQTFDSMVVVTTLQNDAASPSLIPRIQAADGASFQLRLERTDGATGAITKPVHFLVVEEGVYNVAEHGIKMEAVRFNSSVTDHRLSWFGQAQHANLAHSYNTPVVVGQVMSSNDPQWSAFWSRGTARNEPVSSNAIYVGKHVGDAPNTAIVDELIGYVVIEAGSGMIGNVPYEAAIGDDTVLGITNGGGNYPLTSVSTPEVAIASMTGMDGTDGGWAVLNGENAITATSIDWAVEEDQAADAERGHVDEQLAYIVFGSGAAQATPAAFRMTQELQTQQHRIAQASQSDQHGVNRLPINQTRAILAIHGRFFSWQFITPRIQQIGSTTGRVFPFRFCWQTAVFIDPFTIRLCPIPTDIINRVIFKFRHRNIFTGEVIR